MTLDALRMCPYVARAAVESTVGLVIVRSGDRVNAMTVSFFSELAHYPASIWISVSPKSYTHALLSEMGEFSLALLHRGQADIAIACGTVSGRDKNKCSQLELYDNGSGFLFLKDAISSTACRVYRSLSLGDHTMFLAKMLSGDIRNGRVRLPNLLISDLKAQ
jgi:flavin reductase (DIM6/NTAB) family NADH-FMN oxidoreductase RutF